MKILITSDLTERQVEEIRAVSEENQVVVASAKEEMEKHLSDTEVFFGNLTRNMYEQTRKLRWVQTESAGVDSLMFDEFVGSDTLLTSAKGTVGTHLADHAWALLLALLRGVHTSIRGRTWDNRVPIRMATWELGGKTMGLIGLGGTGVETARRAQSFDMRVIAIEPEGATPPPFVEQVWKPDRFHDLLAESDVVVICAPLTKGTYRMFDAEAFSKMKPHALLINVTRGRIIDEEALLDALRTGKIGGAGLDVTWTEPLPPDHPLWDMPNVIVTPHTAGGSPDRLDRTVEVFCENLRRLDGGQPLLGQIDKTKEY